MTPILTRTYRFAILGMSLSNLLDISQPQDLLRLLANTLSEYEEDGDKPKIVRLPSLKDKRSSLMKIHEAPLQTQDEKTSSWRLPGIRSHFCGCLLGSRPRHPTHGTSHPSNLQSVHPIGFYTPASHSLWTTTKPFSPSSTSSQKYTIKYPKSSALLLSPTPANT